MIKAIFFDIDGTLVSFKTHQIPQSAVDTIVKAKEKGIKIYIYRRVVPCRWSIILQP